MIYNLNVDLSYLILWLLISAMYMILIIIITSLIQLADYYGWIIINIPCKISHVCALCMSTSNIYGSLIDAFFYFGYVDVA